MKIVINKSHGGFGLSHLAVMELTHRKGIALFSYTSHYVDHKHIMVPILTEADATDRWHIYYFTRRLSAEEEAAASRAPNEIYFSIHNYPRDDVDLVAVVEEMGPSANGVYADLTVVEIPDDVQWEIKEYDGSEWVAEKHRTWY